MFPVKDMVLYELIQKQLSVFWVASIHKYEADKKDYNTLPIPISSVLDFINAQFASGDGIIINNITYRLQLTAVDPEEIIWYSVQGGTESVHTIAYSLIINNIIESKERREELFNAVNTIPSISSISNWMKDMTFSDRPREEILVAFACGEGLLFPVSFIPIFYMRIKNKMQVMVDVNKDISRDESLHLDVAIVLIKRTNISKDKIREIVQEFTGLLFNYIDEMFRPITEAKNEDLIGTDGTDYSDLRKEEMILFAKYNTDSLLRRLDCKEIYYIHEDDLPSWVLTLSCEHKNNFHERTSTNYVQSSEVTETDKIEYEDL
jgi:ribonucleoside-diphosphate reductase subunit M2